MIYTSIIKRIFKPDFSLNQPRLQPDDFIFIITASPVGWITTSEPNTGLKIQCFCHLFIRLPPQGGDSDDDVEGFGGSDDTQPSGDSLPPPSQDLEGVSTYGEDDLVPEPHRVSNTWF